MRRIFIAPVLALTLILPGCAGTKLGDLIQTATTTIVNPVDAVDIYQVKNVYAASLQAAVDWRAFCWSKPYTALMADPVAKPICEHRRPWLRAIQLAKAKASVAVVDATVFVRDNPTLDASKTIAAAWGAVTDFKNAIPAKN